MKLGRILSLLAFSLGEMRKGLQGEGDTVMGQGNRVPDGERAAEQDRGADAMRGSGWTG